MTRNEIKNEYFEWLFGLVCEYRYSSDISYDRLLTMLHETEFIFTHPRDENRAEDGIDLRWRFVYEHDYPNSTLFKLDGPCSILEMMIALAIRCEENIMDDPCIGNRTGQWFWGMIISLGLGAMTDSRYNRLYVDETIDRFLNREYDPDGKGGLFTIEDCDRDLRTVEIWYQLCWYLDSIT